MKTSSAKPVGKKKKNNNPVPNPVYPRNPATSCVSENTSQKTEVNFYLFNIAWCFGTCKETLQIYDHIAIICIWEGNFWR